MTSVGNSSQSEEQSNKRYPINALVREFRITSRTIRFYDNEGLISSERDRNRRVYSSRERARLILILRGRRVGLSLNQIRRILDLYEKNDGGRAQLRLAGKTFKSHLAALEGQKKAIEESIRCLGRAIAAVDHAVAHNTSPTEALRDVSRPQRPTSDILPAFGPRPAA